MPLFVRSGATLFTAQTGGIVRAFDAKAGAEKWRFTLDGIGTPAAGKPNAKPAKAVELTTPIVTKGILITSAYWMEDDTSPTSTGRIIALDAHTGHELWRRTTNGVAHMAFAGELLLFVPRGGPYRPDGTDALYAVNVKTGKGVWEFTHRTHDIQNFFPHSDAIIVSRMGGGLLSGLNPATGKEDWFREPGIDVDQPAFSVGGAAVVIGDSFETRKVDGYTTDSAHICCVVASTGRVLWKRTFEHSSSSGITLDGLLYIHADSQLLALDPLTGQKIWSQVSISAEAVSQTPAVRDGVVSVGWGVHSDRDITKFPIAGFDSATGRKKWSFELPMSGARPAVIAGRTAFVTVLLKKGVSDYQLLLAVDVQRGTTLWKREIDPTATVEVDGDLIRVYGREIDVLNRRTGRPVR
ncbi:PQQ-binding-like beta-propeller repeat protein [Streptomyces sp. NPDC020898]|uniref:PQQ-binding-like beta-propeller repeat protein n=1 Tax=Streptomyces sp. NPDC020898 TaxID=3365101 RepID=UPI00379E599E